MIESDLCKKGKKCLARERRELKGLSGGLDLGFLLEAAAAVEGFKCGVKALR